MAEFVEVGGANFLSKDFGIAFGKVPEVVEVENDARGRIRGMGVGLQAVGALEEAEEVGLKTLVQNRLVRNGLVKGDDRFRGRAEFGRQAGADALHTSNCQPVKFWIHRLSLGLGLGLRKSAAWKVLAQGNED